MAKSPETTSSSVSKVRRLGSNFPFLFAVGVVIFALSFAVASFPLNLLYKSPDVVQKVYFADNIGRSHQELIRQFNERYQGQIEVIPIDLPFAKFNTNERKELIARNLRSQSSRIDVFAVDQIWVQRFIKWAEPLSQHFSANFIDKLLPEATRTCYVDGALYAIPLYIDIGVLYYRQDMILALPQGREIERRLQESISWQELISLGQRYFPGRPIYLLQGEAYEGLICNFNEILGLPLQSAGSRQLIDLTSPRVVGRLTFMRSLIYDYGIVPPDVVNLTEDESLLFAMEHDIPFVRGWPTVDSKQDTRFATEKFSRFRIAPLPHFEEEVSTPVFGGWNMMLSRHSPVKEAAITFMHFVSSREGQQVFYDAGVVLPVYTELYDQMGQNKRQDRINRLREFMQQGIHRPSLPDYTRISDILSQEIHAVLMDSKSPELALETAQQRIDALADEDMLP